ncbi:MAG TPA: biotin-dependent carboxyltransferase family protein [Candidatus Limnocylindria bacterium]
MMRITAPGLRATVQDRGRYGHARDGVPPAGPADPAAFGAALALAGCDSTDAAIEIVGLPFAFRCDDRRVIAATGPDVRIRTRGSIAGWTSVLARPGDEIVIEGAASTRYAYVAVSGGLALDPVLGSRATYVAASLGPWPRPLAAGDALPLGPSTAGVDAAGRRIEAERYDRPARAVAGPHDDRFAPAAIERFFTSAFAVLPEGDRMAARLGGVDVAPAAADLLSCGVLAGAVQVPRGGDPIVLLADHQTTGGYPIIATVIAADLGVIAQAVPGQYVRFERVTPDEVARSD